MDESIYDIIEELSTAMEKTIRDDINDKNLKTYFLVAIGKEIDSKIIEESTSQGAELQRFILNIRYTKLTSKKNWDDSIVTTKFNSWKKPKFELAIYVDCVKWFYLAYFGLTENIAFPGLSEAMTYILAHAQNPSDPTKNLIEFCEQADNEVLNLPTLPNDLDTKLPSDTPYKAAIADLLESLAHPTGTQNITSNIMYQQLNANVTYLMLLLIRRIIKTEEEFQKSLMKKESHVNYSKLCPHPLDDNLPIISKSLNMHLNTLLTLEPMIYLVMMAFMQCKDKTTDNLLKVTCLQHLEWTGLLLPRLFFKVSKLYNIEEGELWDILGKYDKNALKTLYITYFDQYTGIRGSPPKSYKFFPYCRLFDPTYHNDLAPRHNLQVCFILAYLHDLKFGLEKSSARFAHWTKIESARIGIRISAEQIAMSIYDELLNRK